MKRKITYVADDGTAFEDRISAKRHETDVVRRKCIEKCLREILPDLSTLNLDVLITAMSTHAGKLSDALSARAAARSSKEAKVSRSQSRKAIQ